MLKVKNALCVQCSDLNRERGSVSIKKDSKFIRNTWFILIDLHCVWWIFFYFYLIAALTWVGYSCVPYVLDRSAFTVLETRMNLGSFDYFFSYSPQMKYKCFFLSCSFLFYLMGKHNREWIKIKTSLSKSRREKNPL